MGRFNTGCNNSWTQLDSLEVEMRRGKRPETVDSEPDIFVEERHGYYFNIF